MSRALGSLEFSLEHSVDACMHACYNTTMICFTFYQQVGRLQQKVDEMEMTQRDLVAEYEEHVLHLKEEVYQAWTVSLWFTNVFYSMNQPQFSTVYTRS